MPRKAPETKPPAGSPAWMASYGDMMTNLLGFFVILFSMSSVDVEKMESLLGSLSQTFNPKAVSSKQSQTGPLDDNSMVGSVGFIPSSDVTVPMVSPMNKQQGQGRSLQKGGSRVEEDLRQLTKRVQELARQMKLDKQLKAELTARGVVISFAESDESVGTIVPFESGSAQLRPPFKAVLDKLAPMLAQMTNKIEVQGHTDYRPIHTVAYPSNWELSGARAGSVVRYLLQRHSLNEDQFVCTGFADTVPVDLGTSPGALARNRRIEIVVTRHPVATYDAMSRADSAQTSVDITRPIGDVVHTGLPAAP